MEAIPDDKKVRYLCDAKESNSAWSVDQMLMAAYNDVKRGAVAHKKAILIFVDTEGNLFAVNSYRANIKNSEAIAAIEIHKKTLMEEMGF